MAINVEPEENIDEEVDTTKDLQVGYNHTVPGFGWLSDYSRRSMMP